MEFFRIVGNNTYVTLHIRNNAMTAKRGGAIKLLGRLDVQDIISRRRAAPT